MCPHLDRAQGQVAAAVETMTTTEVMEEAEDQADQVEVEAARRHHHRQDGTMSIQAHSMYLSGRMSTTFRPGLSSWARTS